MTNSLDIHRFTVCSPGPPTGPRHLHSASPKTDMSSFRALWIPRVLWVPRVPGSGSWNGELQGAWGYDLSTSSTRRRLMCSPWSRWMWNDVGDMHHNEIRQSKGIKHDITWLKQPIWWGLWGYGIWPYFAARNRWYRSQANQELDQWLDRWWGSSFPKVTNDASVTSGDVGQELAHRIFWQMCVVFGQNVCLLLLHTSCQKIDYFFTMIKMIFSSIGGPRFMFQLK